MQFATMSLHELHISTSSKEELIDITSQISELLKKEKLKDGICIIHVPHTTAAVTINENADPDVQHDLLLGLDKAFPDRNEFRHSEGNSSAHLKSLPQCQVVNSKFDIKMFEANFLTNKLICPII